MAATASAPGKLMLLGEHAVVYGHPCLVTAVNLRYQVTVERTNEQNISILVPDLSADDKRTVPINEIGQNYSKDTSYVEAVIAGFYKKYGISSGLHVATQGPATSHGLGSSSAVSVASTLALATEFEINLTNRDIFDVAFAAVLDVQRGKASGFDVASAVFGGTLYFHSGGEVIEAIEIDHLPIVIGYSGKKVGTVSLVEQVALLQKRYPNIIDTIYNLIHELVESAKKEMLQNNWQNLGELMNINQGFLDALNVNTDKLSSLIYHARSAGAYGAKLSGAGGGDCMFALIDEKDRSMIEIAIEQAGGEVVNLATNAPGVLIESHN